MSRVRLLAALLISALIFFAPLVANAQLASDQADRTNYGRILNKTFSAETALTSGVLSTDSNVSQVTLWVRSTHPGSIQLKHIGIGDGTTSYDFGDAIAVVGDGKWEWIVLYINPRRLVVVFTPDAGSNADTIVID